MINCVCCESVCVCVLWVCVGVCVCVDASGGGWGSVGGLWLTCRVWRRWWGTLGWSRREWTAVAAGTQRTCWMAGCMVVCDWRGVMCSEQHACKIQNSPFDFIFSVYDILHFQGCELGYQPENHAVKTYMKAPPPVSMYVTLTFVLACHWYTPCYTVRPQLLIYSHGRNQDTHWPTQYIQRKEKNTVKSYYNPIGICVE